LNSPRFYSVITTIQAPTKAMVKLGKSLGKLDGHLLVVGDKKGPFEYPLETAELLTVDKQLQLPLRMPSLLPFNHYSRKNLGYLVAISRGAECIYETDDDNGPIASWGMRSLTTKARKISRQGWCNAYQYFTKDYLWPRGFPLDEIEASRKTGTASRPANVCSPIQQGLVDGNPDVDAIWRLVLQGRTKFAQKPSVALMPGVWCPFNTQSTWWWPEAYPLMYLPSYCTFRMTDIWRSFIAQRCVWEMGGVVTFHAPEVFQDRNPHKLLKDFEDEVPGYLQNDKIRQTISELKLDSDPQKVGDNLYQCYQALVEKDIFPKKELRLVKEWLADLKKVAGKEL
jgi:hypothetical protein